MKFIFLLFCVLHQQFPFALLQDVVEADQVGLSARLENEEQDPSKDKQYQMEIAAGDTADLFSTNIHKAVPPNFVDFGRRFVVQYPYYEKSAAQVDTEAEDRLHQAIKEFLKKVDKTSDDGDILHPLQASPDVVLAVARQSALLEKSKHYRPDEYHKKANLRTGKYWNAFWKEDMENPDENYLRTEKRLDSVKVKIMPGSKLYKLVSMTKDLSPRMLYIINNKEEDKHIFEV